MELPFSLPIDPVKLERITILACGTAYMAGLTAKYWFESFCRLPVEIDVASEFRYREAPMRPGGLTIVVSQSGETADTLASLRYTLGCQRCFVGLGPIWTQELSRSLRACLHALLQAG